MGGGGGEVAGILGGKTWGWIHKTDAFDKNEGNEQSTEGGSWSRNRLSAEAEGDSPVFHWGLTPPWTQTVLFVCSLCHGRIVTPEPKPGLAEVKMCFWRGWCNLGPSWGSHRHWWLLFFRSFHFHFYFLKTQGTLIIFIVVQLSSQPNWTTFPPQTPSPSLPPQPVSFGNHKLLKVCESVSVLQRSSFCPFFRFHI